MGLHSEQVSRDVAEMSKAMVTAAMAAVGLEPNGTVVVTDGRGLALGLAMLAAAGSLEGFARPQIKAIGDHKKMPAGMTEELILATLEAGRLTSRGTSAAATDT